jgi:hypothetical protein
VLSPRHPSRPSECEHETASTRADLLAAMFFAGVKVDVEGLLPFLKTGWALLSYHACFGSCFPPHPSASTSCYRGLSLPVARLRVVCSALPVAASIVCPGRTAGLPPLLMMLRLPPANVGTNGWILNFRCDISRNARRQHAVKGMLRALAIFLALFAFGIVFFVSIPVQQRDVSPAVRSSRWRASPARRSSQALFQRLNSSAPNEVVKSNREPFPAPPLVTVSEFTAQSFPACTHWSRDTSSAFAIRANAARSQTQQPHAIPRQLLFVFGLWDDFSFDTMEVSAKGNSDGVDLSSSPEKAAQLPSPQRERLLCWLQTHPAWRVLVWDLASAHAFMRRYHPELLSVYAGYRRVVQQSDLLRVLLVARFGGLYMDLDVRPPAANPRPLEELWTAHPRAAALLFEESILTPEAAWAAAQSFRIRNNRPEECQRIANYLIASSPLHAKSSVRSILQRSVQLMRDRASLEVRSDYDVLYTTGPALLTEAVHKYALGQLADARFQRGLPAPTLVDVSRKTVCVMASDLLREAANLRPESLEAVSVDIVRRPEDQRYFDHMVTGTWRNDV